MTTAGDLKSFFETDTVSLLSSFSTPDTPVSYVGQGQRKGVGSFEVQVKYDGELPVNDRAVSSFLQSRCQDSWKRQHLRKHAN